MEDEYNTTFDDVAALYYKLIARGVPAEDARFVLPNATSTNLKITVNFAEFLHIADLRLCTRAQWEFRKVVAMMRAEVMRTFPELARYLQPKCGEYRMGYCDEAYEDWLACPIGRKRPHKRDLFAIYDAHRRGEYTPVEVAKASDEALDAVDFQIIEAEESST
jgi:thymidylate synthase (FAD)